MRLTIPTDTNENKYVLLTLFQMISKKNRSTTNFLQKICILFCFAYKNLPISIKYATYNGHMQQNNVRSIRNRAMLGSRTG